MLDQLDKIRKTETSHNEDSVKVTFRTDIIGNISIVGSTQDVHETAFSKIKTQSVKLEIEEKVEEKIVETINTEEIFENWGEPVNDSSQDYTAILVIIGIIVAIIIGVIIKIKKN